ncbi:alpha/beta hydrolase family protein [Daejeonella sp.]|jgi:pimeloyl-ACP methyl ester carboxylesterase|uniref:alpha/beta hydrolase family protein n=1 Tax=Daejeonella sp. TaxID=2805397 RepID=UPI0037BE547D
MRYFSSLTFRLLMILTMLIASTSVANAGQESRLKLINKQFPRLSDLKIPISTTWNGFEIMEFKFDGVDAKIVFPNQSNKAKNWIWRTQFWGHEPQTDIALLNKGFHVVYVDVVDLYGNKVAVTRLNAFYAFLIKNFGLNKKTVLEGMSRGGLDAYNWASENTDKVFCIYADAPVCDIKSWPGGLGKGEGSKNDWMKCLQAYGLTESTVKEFKDIPINNCVKLAKAKIPLITVCGDADTVVPIDENTYKLAAVYKAAGGKIELIIKKGIGHHPHSLKDPMPIVDFILKNTMN